MGGGGENNTSHSVTSQTTCFLISNCLEIIYLDMLVVSYTLSAKEQSILQAELPGNKQVNVADLKARVYICDSTYFTFQIHTLSIEGFKIVCPPSR